MRPIAIVLVVVALGIAGLTAFLAKRFLASQATPQGQGALAVPTTQVLVAAKDILAGAVLTDADLIWQAWPETALDRRFVLKGAGEDPRNQFIGSIARRNLITGEPVTADRVFKQENAGVLSGLLAPGFRAVSLAVSERTGVAGFILPGDRVDVVLTLDLKESNSGRSGGGRSGSKHVGETILRDVRVLAVDQKLDEGKAPALVAKNVVVEVTPQQAERLFTAEAMGTLHLALRSLTPGDGEEPEGTFAIDETVIPSITAARAQVVPVFEDEQARPTARARPAPRAASSGGPIRIYRNGDLEMKQVR